MEWAWLIPIFSFAAAPLIVVFGKFLPGKGSWLSILAIGGGFVMFWVVLNSWLAANAATSGCFTSENTGMLTCDYERSWFNAGIVGEIGSVSLHWGILVDPLTIAMLGLVTFVALMVQIYSLAYMHGDPRFGWYFAVHSLFAAAMLTLVLADNFLLLYVAWELVGICSYLLIGFWHERPQAREDRRCWAFDRHPPHLARSWQLQHAGCLRSGPHWRNERGSDYSRGVTAVLRRHGQVCPSPLPRMVARRDGGSDPGQRPDSRRHYGHRRRIPGGPGIPIV
jgi:hypothetical protein